MSVVLHCDRCDATPAERYYVYPATQRGQEKRYKGSVDLCEPCFVALNVRPPDRTGPRRRAT